MTLLTILLSADVVAAVVILVLVLWDAPLPRGCCGSAQVEREQES